MRNAILLYSLLLLLPLATSAQRVETDPETKKKGLVDPFDGLVLIPFEYDDLQLTSDRAWVRVQQNGLWGLMDLQGHLRVPIRYGQIDFGGYTTYCPNGFAAVAETNKWGLVDLQGKLALPIQYQYVASLDSNLLVASFAGDPILRFFDGRGTPLFSTPGVGVVIGSSNEFIMIVRSWTPEQVFDFVDRKGARPFPARIQAPRWMKGEYVVCGPFGQQGVLNTRGDTVLPCLYKSVFPSGDGNFIVEGAKGFKGVIDPAGRVIIPLTGWDIFSWSARPESAYLVKNDKGFNLYDHQGQLRVTADKITRLGIRQADKGGWSPPGENLDRYADVQKGARKGFYDDSGRMIVPVEYASVRYLADGYAVIAERPDGLSDAYNIQGKKLLPQAFARLEMTRDSMLLLGQGATKKWGFIHLDRPAETRFEFDQLISLPSGFFATQGLTGWQILDPALRRVAVKRVLEKVEAPEWADFYQFYKKKHPGRLVALVRVKGEAVWYGVNDQGAMFAWGLQPGKGEEPVIQDAGDRN